jgi:SAM-dependent methyltransferase
MASDPPIAAPALDRARFTQALHAAGYTFDAVKARLGTRYRQWSPQGEGTIGKLRCLLEYASMRTDIGRAMLSPAGADFLSNIAHNAAEFLRIRRPRDNLDALIQLFLFNQPVQDDLLSNVIDLNGLAATGLIRFQNDAVVCDVALFECAGLFIATDGLVRWLQNLNVVMPLIPESFDLVAAVPRNEIDSALDLCTGSGVHALVAARHANRVIGTDISSRAIEFAKFNAWLNSIDNVEFRQGSLFGPVSGESFDLIVANPPYMPATDSSPGDNFYCGGKHGDFLWAQIVRGLKDHLRPEGSCYLIHMIALFDGQSAEGKIAELLGPLHDACAIDIDARPIRFGNEAIAEATSVLFGVTCISRSTARPGRARAKQKKIRYSWRGAIIAAASTTLCFLYIARELVRRMKSLMRQRHAR